jgi:hypothetical protein
VDITLDYIRKPKERYIKIICENGKNLHYDFMTNILGINDKKMVINDNIEQSYIGMLKALLGTNKINENKLSSIEDGLNVLKILEI